MVVVAEFTGRMTGSGVKSTPVVRRIPITPRPTIPDNSEVKLGHIFRKKSAEVLSVRIFGFFKISEIKGFFLKVKRQSCEEFQSLQGQLFQTTLR